MLFRSVTNQIDISSCDPIDIVIEDNANLAFRNGRKLYLPNGSRVILEGSNSELSSQGGGGSSSIISIGTTTVWSADQGSFFGDTILSVSVLPISLGHFDAKLKNGNVTIEWSTLSEINNDYFDIERSSDGINWVNILSTAGAGNSNTHINYSLVDYNPPAGVAYYRLKQVDFDGESETFKSKSINNNLLRQQNLKATYNIFGQPVDAFNYEGVIIEVYDDNTTSKKIGRAHV